MTTTNPHNAAEPETLEWVTEVDPHRLMIWGVQAATAIHCLGMGAELQDRLLHERRTLTWFDEATPALLGPLCEIAYRRRRSIRQQLRYTPVWHLIDNPDHLAADDEELDELRRRLRNYGDLIHPLQHDLLDWGPGHIVWISKGDHLLLVDVLCDGPANLPIDPELLAWAAEQLAHIDGKLRLVNPATRWKRFVKP